MNTQNDNNKSLLRVFADFGGSWDWGDFCVYDGGISQQLYDDFVKWQSWFECNSDTYFFDWKAFNIQGMNLCIKAKEEVGDSVTVTYESACEDEFNNEINKLNVEILLNDNKSYIDNYEEIKNKLSIPYSQQLKIFSEIHTLALAKTNILGVPRKDQSKILADTII